MKGVIRFVLVAASLIGAGAISAQLVTLDARNLPYSTYPAIQGVTSSTTPSDLRNAALSAAAGAYRAQKPFEGRLPAGSQFRMIYQDGSSETGQVNSVASTDGAVPVPGSQLDSNGNPLSGSGGGGFGGDFGGGGYDPGPGTSCVTFGGGTGQACTSVPGSPPRCESVRLPEQTVCF